MFARLFARSGLSLDRLRALVEVGAHGSIVRAAEGDLARQSQYSRQIKELEDFFQVALVERHGKGVRLTARGRELARISRFFLLGMSNFQRGCLAAGQTYRIGAEATFLHTFLLPALAVLGDERGDIRFVVETAGSREVERRLHELTLDFGIVNQSSMSRPLQVEELGRWRLGLWVPKTLGLDARRAAQALKASRLPLAWPERELPLAELDDVAGLEPALTCETFLEAKTALTHQRLATPLPEFLVSEEVARLSIAVRVPALAARQFGFWLVWNPRLLRLNPHAVRQRDALIQALTRRFAAAQG